MGMEVYYAPSLIPPSTMLSILLNSWQVLREESFNGYGIILQFLDPIVFKHGKYLFHPLERQHYLGGRECVRVRVHVRARV